MSMERAGRSANWSFILRVIVKAAILFAACNLIFALLNPIEALGRVSLYNVLVPGRDRLPYGENPAAAYNLSTYNVPAMFASHRIAAGKPDGEFRVLLLGDSNTWGWLLDNSETIAARINEAGYVTADGQRVVAYNLGYPVMSLTKDLMLLDEAMAYQPDLIVWLVTLASFPREKQLFPPLVQNNPERVRDLIERYDLALDRNDPRFVDAAFLDRTIVGQRRALADWLRLQLYGFAWAYTGVDQFVPDEIPLRQSDFEADVSWEDFDAPAALTADDLAFDVLAAGVERAGGVPVVIVNEPMFISSGVNSDLRYNSFYPRWAYDAYRELFAEVVEANGWRALDLWDAIAPDAFTDSPVHLTAEGTQQLSDELGAALVDMGLLVKRVDSSQFTVDGQ